MPTSHPQADVCPFAFLLTVKENAPFEAQDLIQYLENAKIQTRRLFSGNILYHDAYRDYAWHYENLAKDFPISELLMRNAFFLGVYIGITDEKMTYIKQTVDKFFEELNDKI